MATSFQYVVFPHHMKKDGTIPVKIRMIHKGKAKYFPTSVAVTKRQLTRKMDKITDAQVLEAVSRKVDAFRRAASTIDGAEWMTADELQGRVLAAVDDKGEWRLDFIAYAKDKTESMNPKTAEGYRNSLHALQRFIGRDSIDVNEITYTLLLSFRNFLETEPAVSNGKGRHQAKHKGSRAVSYYLSCLRHIHNLARDEFNDDDIGLIRIPRQPFKKGLIPQQPLTEHRTLTAEQIRRISECEPKTKRGRMAKDVFMLSFYTIGMNTVDMFKAVHSDVKGGVLTYHRSKTKDRRQDKAEMRVRVEPEAKALLARNKGVERLLSFAERYSTSENFNRGVNEGMKEICGLVGLGRITTYHARHTWATIARNRCKIPRDTVDEALDHAPRGGDRVTDVYIERDWKMLWDANRSVIDLVFGTKEKRDTP